MTTPPAADELARRSLTARDLTDPANGPHAIQQLITLAHTSLAQRWNCRRLLHRTAPLVSDAAPLGASDDRITRRLQIGLRLRSRVGESLAELLASQALDPPDDLLLVNPGAVYRRSPIGPLHCAEPHQLALCRIHRGGLSTIQLAEMVQTVIAAVLPGRRYRLLPAARPHLSHGMRIDLADGDRWITVGHAGLVKTDLLVTAGLADAVTAMQMVLGLDRLLMLRKSIGHIRLLRSRLPDVAEQMIDLEPFRPPVVPVPVIRELRLSAPISAEDLADCVRLALPARLESIDALEPTGDGALRLTLSHPYRPLGEHEADLIRDEVADVLEQSVPRPQKAYA